MLWEREKQYYCSVTALLAFVMQDCNSYATDNIYISKLCDLMKFIDATIKIMFENLNFHFKDAV